MFDHLETRRLLSFTYDSATKTTIVTGTSGNDLMYAAWKVGGGSGPDVLRVSDGSTTQDYTYYPGPYQLTNLAFYGGDGTDTIYGSYNLSGFTNYYQKFSMYSSLTINGDGGNDTLYGAESADTINGGNQNDAIYGGGGSDLLQGNNNNDTIYGGANDDTLFGQAGSDVLQGDSGSDVMNGGTDIDTVYGYDGVGGNDVLYLDNGELFNADNGDYIVLT